MFANGLKNARKRAGLSAQDAAALLTARGLECTRGTLLAWERGVGPTTREPFSSDLMVIAAVYDCSISCFFAEPEEAGSEGSRLPNSPPEPALGQRPPLSLPLGLASLPVPSASLPSASSNPPPAASGRPADSPGPAPGRIDDQNG